MSMPGQIVYESPGFWTEGAAYLTVWSQQLDGYTRIEGVECGMSSQWYDMPKTWVCT